MATSSLATAFTGGNKTYNYPTYTYGPSGTTRTNPSDTAAGKGVDPLLLQSSVGQLLGFQGQADEYAAAAEGSRLNATGAGIEAAAYGTAAGIATGNEQSEAIAESVRQIQIMRNVNQTVGGISASVAANGFQQSGSALDIMRSSYQQGALEQQISGLQSEQTQRGYLSQAAAANGEMGAATARQLAALSLADAQDKAGASATANQAALSHALTQLLAGDPNAQQLVNDLTSGNISGATADALLYNPAGSTNPLATAGGTGTAGTGPNNTPANPFSTNPNFLAAGYANNVVQTPVENVMLGQAFGASGLVSGSAPSIGQSNNVTKAFS